MENFTSKFGIAGHLKWFWPLSNNPEYILLYCSTNDLSQDISAVDTGKKIIEAAVSCKSDNNIFVFENVHDILNIKTTQVNIHFRNEFNKRNICFIDKSN